MSTPAPPGHNSMSAAAADGIAAAVLPPHPRPTGAQLAGCYGKAAHPSKGAALETFRHVRKRKGKTLGFRAYRCQHCHAWHLATPGSGL